MQLKFNGVEIPRSKIGELETALCAELRSAEAALAEVAEQQEEPTSPSQTTDSEAGRGSSGERGFPEMLDSWAHGTGERLGELFGGSLARVAGLRMGEVSDQSETVRFKVLGSNEREFVLEIEGGVFDGQIFRLDRRMDLNVEFLFEAAGYFTFGQRIETLTVDSQGRVNATVATDCSRDLHMEIFNSEHARGPPPGCETQ